MSKQLILKKLLRNQFNIYILAKMYVFCRHFIVGT